ncbi:hypothetical protein RAS1_28510 [Phycisphaerae bacterium RAS1]|nr:hypothetical protein RAS1_28510 [Phycisphaerae bacterium RAS1]
MSRNKCSNAALAALFGFACTASADTVTEVGDTGDLPGSAQVTTGVGALTLITGALSGFDDADMYAITIVDINAFSATTDDAGTAVFDTQLFLFDSSGLGVSANDDISHSPYTPHSALNSAGTYKPAAPGVYFLAVSGWDRDPNSGGAAMFNDDTVYTGVVGPVGAGGASPISGWDGNGDMNGGVGAYSIVLAGAEFASVPEPGTLALFASAAACGYVSRRRLASH